MCIEKCLAFVILCVSTIYNSLIYICRSDKNVKLEKSKIKQNDQETTILEIKKIDYSEIESNMKSISESIQNSIPFILTNIPKEYFEILETNYYSEIDIEDNQNILIFNTYLFPTLDKLSTFIKKITDMSVLYMATFQGNYKAGYAHIDSFTSYNFYYLKSGTKRVWLLPKENTQYLNMKNGIDSIYVEDDNSDTNKLEWLNTTPSYYDFNLNSGEVLIFNNSNCIHKFENLTRNNMAYTIRLMSNNCNTLVLKHDIMNWEMSKHYANIILNKKINRETNNI
jgi:hypothetical protein